MQQQECTIALEAPLQTVGNTLHLCCGGAASCGKYSVLLKIAISSYSTVLAVVQKIRGRFGGRGTSYGARYWN